MSSVERRRTLSELTASSERYTLRRLFLTSPADHTNPTPFFGTYLLTPLGAHRRTTTYVGFAVAPARRIAQHNGGVAKGGAQATAALGPWEMLCVLHGFSTASAALRFEYAWQHAYSAASTRERMVWLLEQPRRGSALTVRRRVAELCAMLDLPQWREEDLTLTFTSMAVLEMVAPDGLQVNVRPVQSFPTTGNPNNFRCFVCSATVARKWRLECRTPSCKFSVHLQCVVADLVPHQDGAGDLALGPTKLCPLCEEALSWKLRVDVALKRKGAPGRGLGLVLHGRYPATRSATPRTPSSSATSHPPPSSCPAPCPPPTPSVARPDSPSSWPARPASLTPSAAPPTIPGFTCLLPEQSSSIAPELPAKAHRPRTNREWAEHYKRLRQQREASLTEDIRRLRLEVGMLEAILRRAIEH